MAQLAAAAELGAAEYFPVSARTGAGLDAARRPPRGPGAAWPGDVPDSTPSHDVPDEQWVAELVREQLLAVTREELPYSIATRVTEWEGDRITVEIVVERESQKGMVIGKGGAVLRQVGERARAQLPDGHVPRPAGQGRQGLAASSRPCRATRATDRPGEELLVVPAGDVLVGLGQRVVPAQHLERRAVEGEADPA